MAVRLNKAVKQSVSLLSGFKQWGMPTITSTDYYVDYQLPISMPHEVLMVVCSDLVGEAATTATIWKTCWNVKASTTTTVRIISDSQYASSMAAIIIGY